MFKIIHQALQLDDFYGISDEIDVACGVNKTPETLKEAYEIAKRKIMSNPNNDKT